MRPACVSTEALQLQREAVWVKHGRRPAQLEELIRSLEQSRDVTAGQHAATRRQGAYLNRQRSWALIEEQIVDMKWREMELMQPSLWEYVDCVLTYDIELYAPPCNLIPKIIV